MNCLYLVHFAKSSYTQEQRMNETGTAGTLTCGSPLCQCSSLNLVLLIVVLLSLSPQLLVNGPLTASMNALVVKHVVVCTQQNRQIMEAR